VTQEVDVQLQVWKDLAISKQVLMGAAADALGLDSECSTAELKAALNKAIQRAKDADLVIIETRTQAEQQVAEAQQRMEVAEKARIEAEAQVQIAVTSRESAEHQLNVGKSDNAEAVKKAKADVADKQNKLKAISKALADTPENVVKKLKTLKKQKMDEAKAKTQAESKLQSTRKEKAKLEAELESQKAALEQAAPLVKQLKELHGLCKQANKTIKKLSEDKKDLLKIPKLDEETIETLEKTLAEK
jgi:colicin import membrane protein